MAQDWDYAKLSESAKAAGGPEQYVQEIEDNGKKIGREQMQPWIAVAFWGGAVCGIALWEGIKKLCKKCKANKKSTQDKVALAKEEIINGINEYNATHEKTMEESILEP